MVVPKVIASSDTVISVNISTFYGVHITMGSLNEAFFSIMLLLYIMILMLSITQNIISLA